jgi:quaternary ammonium compound-resistance protein SugE
MAWVYLLIAGAFECGFTTALRYVDETWPWKPIALFLLCSALSFLFLTLSLRTLPLGTAYAVWTGLGATGTVIIGLIWYNEPMDAARVFFLATLIGSIIGLKLVSAQ